MTEFVTNEPSRFVGDMDSFGELASINAAGLCMQKNGLKPTMDRRSAPFHNGAGDQRSLGMTGATFVEWNTACGYAISMRVMAARTTKTVGPLQLEQKRETIRFHLKHGTKFLKFLRRFFKTHTNPLSARREPMFLFLLFYQTFCSYLKLFFGVYFLFF